MASQSHRTCVSDSSSFRHFSWMGSSVNPSLKRCSFRWQCPVSSPSTLLNWSLVNFNRSLVFLAEGPGVSPFCLSQVVDSQYYLGDFCSCSPWLLSWQLQLRCCKLIQVLWTDVQILFCFAKICGKMFSFLLKSLIISVTLQDVHVRAFVCTHLHRNSPNIYMNEKCFVRTR
jgi:hypothetical protein